MPAAGNQRSVARSTLHGTEVNAAISHSYANFTAPSPARCANLEVRLEVVLAAEGLEVRPKEVRVGHILCPALANRVVTFVVRVLQADHPDHQPDRQARSARQR